MTSREARREAMLDAGAIVRLYVEKRFSEGALMLNTSEDFAELADAACVIAAGLAMEVPEADRPRLFADIVRYAVSDE